MLGSFFSPNQQTVNNVLSFGSYPTPITVTVDTPAGDVVASYSADLLSGPQGQQVTFELVVDGVSQPSTPAYTVDTTSEYHLAMLRWRVNNLSAESHTFEIKAKTTNSTFRASQNLLSVDAT